MKRLVRFGLNEGSSQPLNFILRIFNESDVFRGSFIIQGGSSGLVFSDFFIFSNDYEFTAPTPAEETKNKEEGGTYRTLFYVVLSVFLVFLFSYKKI